MFELNEIGKFIELYMQKIPLPKMIFNRFLLVTVKGLNCYDGYISLSIRRIGKCMENYIYVQPQ